MNTERQVLGTTLMKKEKELKKLVQKIRTGEGDLAKHERKKLEIELEIDNIRFYMDNYILF